MMSVILVFGNLDMAIPYWWRTGFVPALTMLKALAQQTFGSRPNTFARRIFLCRGSA
jgi:hypothetical protein